LPLLLGIIGLLWQANRKQRGVQQFWVVFFLFFMMGIAIVLYLNQTPIQPRERDYAYAGSFYAFAIWVGMGVAGLAELLKRLKLKDVPAAAVATVIGILIPIQMAGQTWDDHDRSGRTVCRDFGQNYLNSTQESGHPILFCNGDNDTFPLWYNVEVEGVRTDVRPCNLSYLQTDWYIDQMKRPAYKSPSLPIDFKRVEYVEGTNEIVYVRPELMKSLDSLYIKAKANPELQKNLYEQFGENPYELKNILKHWVRSTNERLHVIPTDSIVIKVDKEAVRRSGMMMPGDSIPDYMHISLKGKRALYKSELMVLDMLANTNWERPMYIAITVGQDSQIKMDNHLILEGLAYRYTPFESKKLIDTKRMYDNLMHKFRFGGIDKKGIYIEDNVMRMCYTHRRIFSQLAEQLIKEGQKEKALEVLDYCEKMVPAFNVPYDYENYASHMAESYYQLGKAEHGDQILDALANKAVEYATWYLSLSDSKLYNSGWQLERNLQLLTEYVRLMKLYKSSLYDNYNLRLEQIYDAYSIRVGANTKK
jgi:hypothetical protein